MKTLLLVIIVLGLYSCENSTNTIEETLITHLVKRE